MKSEVQTAVKTSYLQYGLKAESIEKVVNAIEARLTAAGTTPENLQIAINEAVELYRPALALIQSEVDSRVKKAPEQATTAAAAATTPADNETMALLKTLMEKVTGLETKDAEQKKITTTQQLIDEAIKISGNQNPAIMKKAIKLVEIKEGMTSKQLSDLAMVEYNEIQSSFSKDGAVPVIPVLGDKATVEAAQKKGVELVDKFLGKPKV